MGGYTSQHINLFVQFRRRIVNDEVSLGIDSLGVGSQKVPELKKSHSAVRLIGT